MIMDRARIGKERGEMAAKLDPQQFVKNMHITFEGAHRLHPTAEMDFAQEIVKYDRERLASQPDIAKFPELVGHMDLLTAERETFKEKTGLDDIATAFRYSWSFFLSRRLASRHLARYDLLPAPGFIPPKQCTNVFFPQGADGVTLSDNRDDILTENYAKFIPAHRVIPPKPGVRPYWGQGGVSSAVLMDDEPACIFPADPFEYSLMPDDCLDDVNDIMEFMSRYKDFWGPGNKIWVDRKLDTVAVEKTNCLVAYRKPTARGAIAITACAYLDEKLHAHHMKKLQQVMKIKGENEKTSPDFCYHTGSRERYRRLVELTNAEASRPGGATLWGALEVVADHAVPFPARVCLAGEKSMPDKEPMANWSLSQHAVVITGPARRSLYRSIQDLYNPRPVYEYTPTLELGAGVEMRAEWQADIDAGRCKLAGG